MTSKNTPLSDAEREYLEDGTASGSYRPHELKNQIEEKVEALPDRLEAVFEDVRLLAKGHFESAPPEEREEVEESKPVPGEHYQPLDTDEGYRAWLELMGFDDEPTKQAIVDEFSYTTGGYGSAPASFGAKLGEMANRLMRWPEFGGVENEDVIADLVWGFLAGIHFHHRLVGDVTEEVVREDAADIIQRVEHRADVYANSRSEPSGLAKTTAELSKRTETRNEMAERVADVLLEDLSVETPTIQSELAARNDSEAGEFFFDVVDHLADAHVADAHPLGSAQQWEAFYDEYGPVEEFDVGEFVTADRVASIIRERRLAERHQLRATLDSDAEALATKKWRGAHVTDVLPKIVEEGAISSRDVADEVLGSSDYGGSVTRLAKDLAGEDCDARSEDTWEDRPILCGDSRGWEATAYGAAVNHALRVRQAHEKSYLQPIETRPFPQELLVDALDEVETIESDSTAP